MKKLFDYFLRIINNYIEYEKTILNLRMGTSECNRILKMINKLPKKYRKEAIQKCYNTSYKGYYIKNVKLEVKVIKEKTKK